MRAVAGSLRARVHCQKRVEIDDGMGNTYGDWQTQFTIAAGFIPKNGGEQVLAGRLQGVQAYIVTIRQSIQSREITPEWRLIDARDDRVFNIRSLADPTGKRAWLELLVQDGVAT